VRAVEWVTAVRESRGDKEWERPGTPGWKPLGTAVSRDVLQAEIEAWTKRIGVSPREVHLRPMVQKWGSCSTTGRVTFNTELLSQPAAFRRRVVVEELLHLRVPNHGKLFRTLLRAFLETE